MQNVNRSLAKTGKKLQSLGAGLSVGLTLPLVALGTSSLKAFDAQAKAIAQVEAGLKSTGNQVGKTSEQLQALASDLQSNSLFGDEDILKNATAQLLTFTNIAGEQFERTQLAALDLATRLDGDLKSASLQLGKALNDPVKNLSALSRSGIQFSDAQKEAINSLAQTNQLAEAQTIILNELENQYGGSAAAAAKAGTGPLKQLSNILGDITEDFGAVIAEGILPFVTYLKEIASKFQDLSPQTKKFIVILGGIAAAIGPLLALAGTILPAIGTGFALLTGPIGLVIAGLTAIAVVIYKNWEHIKKTLADIANYFIDLYNESTVFRVAVEAVVLTFKNLFTVGVFVFDALSSVVRLFADNIKTTFSSLGKIIKGALTFDYDLIKQGLSDAFDGAKSDASKFVNNIKTDFEKLSTGLGTNISEALDNVTQRKKIAFVEANVDASAITNVVETAVQNGLATGAGGNAQVTALPQIQSFGLSDVGTPLTPIIAQMPEQIEQLSEYQLQALDNANQFNEGLGEILSNGAASVAEGFAQYLANFGQGNAGLGALAGLILGTIGNMAIQLGKMAIGIGVAVSGIKKALTSLNPAVAIAGGIALIALGTLVKSAAANLAEGGNVPQFANGGVVGGSSFVGDKILARVNSGELILNQKQQDRLLGLMDTPGEAGGFTTTTKQLIKGSDLLLITTREKNKQSRIG